MQRLQPFFGPRSSGKLWGSTSETWRHAPKPAASGPVPDILVDRTDDHSTQGGRTFELIHTPEGETVDSLTVWMPE